MTKLLGSLLRPNGTLAVIDNWAQGNVSEELAKQVDGFQSHGLITRFGWSEADMKELYEAAGLSLETFKVITPSTQGDNDIFIATAVKKQVEA